jgi:hypothetical protein
MLRDIDRRGNDKTAAAINNVNSSILWNAVSESYKYNEITQVNGTIKAFYTALNRKNYDDARIFWQPTKDVELIVPGREPVVCPLPLHILFSS